MPNIQQSVLSIGSALLRQLTTKLVADGTVTVKKGDTTDILMEGIPLSNPWDVPDAHAFYKISAYTEDPGCGVYPYMILNSPGYFTEDIYVGVYRRWSATSPDNGGPVVNAFLRFTSFFQDNDVVVHYRVYRDAGLA